MQINQSITNFGKKTTVSLDKNDCLSVLRHTFESEETREEAKKLATEFLEKKKEPSPIDVFISNVLLLADEFATETERKAIVRMIKRLKLKYDSKNT